MRTATAGPAAQPPNRPSGSSGHFAGPRPFHLPIAHHVLRRKPPRGTAIQLTLLVPKPWRTATRTSKHRKGLGQQGRALGRAGPSRGQEALAWGSASSTAPPGLGQLRTGYLPRPAPVQMQQRRDLGRGQRTGKEALGSKSSLSTSQPERMARGRWALGNTICLLTCGW